MVYQQLRDDADLEEIKRALYTAFRTDPFITWKQFVGRRLEPSEMVDVYLADLRRQEVPFGGATNRILECAFIAGFPEDVSQLLWMSSRLDKLGIDELLARTQNILKDTELVTAAARTTETLFKRQHVAGDSAVPRPQESQKYYRCGGLNHYSRDCQSQGNTGGVTITLAGDVKLEGKEACVALCDDEPDFNASFDYNKWIWTTRWKETLNNAPTLLCSQIAEYKIPDNIRGEYEGTASVDHEQLVNSIPQGKIRTPKGLIPLMAIIQHTKGKVHLVMDNRELIEHLDAVTVDADICTAKLREWHQQGVNVALLYLWRAYLQVWVHEFLWTY